MSIKLSKDEVIFHQFSIADKKFLLEYTRLSEIGKAVHVEFHQQHSDEWKQDILGNLTMSEAISLFKYIQKDASERLLSEDMVVFSTLTKNDPRSNLYSKIALMIAGKVKVHKAILKDINHPQTFFSLYRDSMHHWVNFQKIHNVLQKYNLLK
jgi:hypothetical protein